MEVGLYKLDFNKLFEKDKQTLEWSKNETSLYLNGGIFR